MAAKQVNVSAASASTHSSPAMLFQTVPGLLQQGIGEGGSKHLVAQCKQSAMVLFLQTRSARSTHLDFDSNIGAGHVDVTLATVCFTS